VDRSRQKILWQGKARETRSRRGCDAGRAGGARGRRSLRQPPQFRRRQGAGRSSCWQAMVETKAITAAEFEAARKQSVQLRTPPEKTPAPAPIISSIWLPATSGGFFGSSSGDLTLAHDVESGAAAARRRGHRAAIGGRRVQRRMSRRLLSFALGKDGAILADGWWSGL